MLVWSILIQRVEQLAVDELSSSYSGSVHNVVDSDPSVTTRNGWMNVCSSSIHHFHLTAVIL